MNKSFAEVSFYIIAHADDWQLFMQPNAYKDLITPRNKVVYIITTAGDAGNDEKYWAAREEGTKSSIRFCLAPISNLSESNSTEVYNLHKISYWSCNNATCYFLRLPDGNLNGDGFGKYNHHSLSKLRQRQINSITAIDNSTTYSNWQDFYNTLETIILTECSGISNTWINYLNPNPDINPKDHADHTVTGQAIQSMGIISNLFQVLFIGYNLRIAQQNLNEADYFWKAGMFAAYEKAVFDGSGYSTLKEDVQLYLNWCSKIADFIIIK